MDGIGEELQQSGMTTLDPARLERFLTADMAFHVMLLRASGNHRMMRIVADSRVLLRIFSSHRQEHNLAVLRDTYRFHSQILEAVKSGDPAAATAAMAAHIQASKQQTLEHFDHVYAEPGGRTPPALPEHLLDELNRITQEFETQE
jgi:DNA-binding GntR family transcriptional regulator